jgi:hypothetical protein
MDVGLVVAAVAATVVFAILLVTPLPFTHKLDGKRFTTPAGSSFIDRGYFTQSLALGGLAALYVALALNLISNAQGSALMNVIAAVLFVLAIMAVGLGLMKVLGFPETRYLNSHRLLANHTFFTLPHEIFTVRTEDGVLIRCARLTKGHTRALVLCHAGFRTMNTFTDVAMAEWLIDDFDIFAFDFRGHGNSGGWYSGDGKTVLDLKAVMNHIKAHYQYEKIGMLGRSIGAWTIIMKEANDHEADSILAAALPDHQVRDCPPLTPLYPIFVNNYVGNVIARIGRGLRPRPYQVGDDPWKVIGRVSPTPLLMVYCEKDKFLGMDREHGMQQLFERAGEPKRIVYLPGQGHVYEIHLLHRYYLLARDWFRETLG